MSELRENKMGTMPVKPLIVSMSLPMMASMLVQALYNVVDSIFVAQVSEEALTAVTLSFPLQNLMIAVATGTGVGMNALLSRALGERDQKQVDHAANAGLFLAFLSFVAFAGIGLFFGPFFIASQTNQPEILQYGVDYTRIVAVLSIGCFLQITCERLLQSTGKTLLSMVSQMAGAIINLILDPIMIFGWFGCPRMEVAGAATATVIGQIAAACIGIFLNRHWNHEIHLRLRDILHPEKETIGKIYYVGVPSILMVSIGSVMTYLMNLILMGFSSTATAVFGAYFKLQSFFFMPVFGLNNGMIPVLAYNYGAGKHRDQGDVGICRQGGTLRHGHRNIGHAVGAAPPFAALPCFRSHDEPGNSGAADHFSPLSDCCGVDCACRGLSGIFTQLLCAGGFRCASAGRADSGRLSFVADGGRQ